MIAQVSSAIGGGLGSVLNLVPTPGKLTIIPVSKFSPVPVPTGLPPYVAMFNPENWQIQERAVHNTARPHGNDGAPARFDGIESRKLSFDLIVDGTGASGEKREVLADVLLLKTTIGFNGDLHQTNRLFVIFGTQMFRGVFESISIKFTLFRPNGIPLRAIISLSFIEDTDPVTGILKMNLLSSDLTHNRLVKDKDRLDLLCHYIYKDPRFYIEAARANNLTSVRKLPLGAELTFPPTEK